MRQDEESTRSQNTEDADGKALLERGRLLKHLLPDQPPKEPLLGVRDSEALRLGNGTSAVRP
eukprot:CAMPEP_0170632060 /NCGR_PEP_ID=MMETSP0224-20130122/35052_1 /TAXON_ID=285029 /ORGANISM="Togula jolla, Strain CCCM 725" /LENGTH=61 /DNA_ID=CAMNT_0010960599 /DNA_START=295 /DNA_END=477 /DNA_ORIENTATION=-